MCVHVLKNKFALVDSNIRQLVQFPHLLMFLLTEASYIFFYMLIQAVNNKTTASYLSKLLGLYSIRNYDGNISSFNVFFEYHIISTLSEPPAEIVCKGVRTSADFLGMNRNKNLEKTFLKDFQF